MRKSHFLMTKYVISLTHILVRNSEINHLLFNTLSYCVLAVQTHAGWSYSEDANCLAAGYSRPTYGNAGSGIYLGRQGIGKAIMPLNDHEEMLVFEVKKKRLTKSKKRHQESKKLGSNINVL